MSLETERALLAQALGGNGQSRVDLYLKFVHKNPRIRRLGVGYGNPDDFLHDCFTNALRFSQAIPEEERFANWVESVAAWTALEAERLRHVDSSIAGSRVRMCAAAECDEAGARLDSYVPPRSGPEDSLPARLANVFGAPQFVLLRNRIIKNETWDESAATAEKPVEAIGPMLVRAVDRLARFFGAPPPLNSDLEPVFAHASALDANAKGTNPLDPTGRVESMQLDSSFYTVTPEMRRIGLKLPSEVRTVVLWGAATEPAGADEGVQGHLAKCRYCSEVMRALVPVQHALMAGGKTEFLLCPGASTLMQDPDDTGEAVEQHLAECATCRVEQSRAFSNLVRESRVVTRWQRVALSVAAAVVMVCMVAGGYHLATKRSASFSLDSADEPQGGFSNKYMDLFQPISLDDPRLLASVLPRDQFRFMEALLDFKQGLAPRAKLKAEFLANKRNDPGARLLYASCLYQEGLVKSGYRAMKEAEATQPRSPFRCWATLQSALAAGDKPVAEREIGHLSGDADFGAGAKVIQAKLAARK